MKRLRVAVWLQTLFLFASQNARAESPATPINAKQRELVYQIQPDGSKILKHQQVGAFYRSSSGATMNTMGHVSTFIDEQGNAYEISHRNKKARFVVRQQPLDVSKLQGIKGYETVNGYNCAVRTILFNGKPAGKAYWHIPYDLQIRWDWKDGESQTVREMYDIEVAEPDQALLGIPEGYSIDSQPEQ